MAIIDVYDALVSQRVYKPAFPHRTAMEIIGSERGKHFDPVLVDAFFEIEGEIQGIAERYTQHV